MIRQMSQLKLRPPKDSSNQNEYADGGGLFDQRVRGAVGKSLHSSE
jgi:hypothetical protein